MWIQRFSFFIKSYIFFSSSRRFSLGNWEDFLFLPKRGNHDLLIVPACVPLVFTECLTGAHPLACAPGDPTAEPGARVLQGVCAVQ